MKVNRIITNGIIVGLFLQLAIGPVFFYIVNLTIQKSFYDGLAGIMGAASVDFLFIILSIEGVGKVLEKKKIKKVYGIIGALALIILGLIMIHEALNVVESANNRICSTRLFSSFLSVLFITISSPMTIVFFTSIFSDKIYEYSLTKKQLYTFGLSIGISSLMFMIIFVIIFFLMKDSIPKGLIQKINILVALILIVYGVLRFIKITKRA